MLEAVTKAALSPKVPPPVSHSRWGGSPPGCGAGGPGSWDHPEVPRQGWFPSMTHKLVWRLKSGRGTSGHDSHFHASLYSGTFPSRGLRGPACVQLTRLGPSPRSLHSTFSPDLRQARPQPSARPRARLPSGFSRLPHRPLACQSPSCQPWFKRPISGSHQPTLARL